MNKKNEWVMLTPLFLAFVLCAYIMTCASLQHAKDVKEVSKYKSQLAERNWEIHTLRSELQDSIYEVANDEKQIKDMRGHIQTLALSANLNWHTEKAKITAYSPLDDKNYINSSGNPHKTSIGMEVGPGRFAVDPQRIPYGSRILIVYPDGTTEQGIAADTGGALRKPGVLKLDIFRRTFAEATSFGHKDNALVIWQEPQETASN